MRTLHSSLAIAAALTLTPAAALACGGMFCNATQPVNQSAERILFARDGETLHMHVRISYAGPPTEFGWLLPAPPDVETALSSEQLFTALDQQLAPIFTLQRQFDDNCLQGQARGGGFNGAPTAEGDDQDADGLADPGVNVLSREAIGPYDRVILAADNVEVLREWLNDNAFAIPDAVDDTLKPYIEMGNVFVAIKLLPGTDSGDILPLHLKFTSTTPAIPIVPTRVAATPDMGVIVHVLDDVRAIPKNYAHVKINEAALDWQNAGANYADVVSAAADEAAEGRAWATDYAGPSDSIPGLIQPYPAEAVSRVEQAETLGDLLQVLNLTDADVQRLVLPYFEIPEGVSQQQYFQCPDCFAEIDWSKEVDGQALAAQFKDEVNAPREGLQELFAAKAYLTRLYTTMSPKEMTQDPIFATNPDLEPIDRQRTAIWHIICDSDGQQLDSLSYVETPSGLRFQFDADGSGPDVILRQDGETVRGGDVFAARVIEQMFEQGPPEVIEDRTVALQQRYGLDKDGGCDCSATQSDPSTLGLFALVGLFGIRRRLRA